MDADSGVVSPIICVPVHTNAGTVKLNLLVDTGSQVSLINSEFVLTGVKREKLRECSYSLKSLGFSKQFRGHELTLDLSLPGEDSPVKFFSVPSWDMEIKAPGIHKLVSILKDRKVLSSVCPVFENDSVRVDGILGIDAIASMKTLEFGFICGFRGLVLKDGGVPFGPLSHLKCFVS